MIHLLLAVIYVSFISLGLPDSLLGPADADVDDLGGVHVGVVVQLVEGRAAGELVVAEVRVVVQMGVKVLCQQRFGNFRTEVPQIDAQGIAAGFFQVVQSLYHIEWRLR